jgi:hypothetical protein
MVTKYVSIAGSDSNNGNTPDTPYRYLPHSSLATHGFSLSAGDTVWLMDGVWGPTSGAAAMDIVGRGVANGDAIQVKVYPGSHARIDNRKFLGTLSWSHQGGGVWSAPFTATALAAAWFAGASLRRATIQNSPNFGEIGLASNTLYINIGENPSGASDFFGSFSGTTGSQASTYALRVRASHGVIIDGTGGLFEIWGGQGGGVLLFQHSGVSESFINGVARRLHLAYSDGVVHVQGAANPEGHAWRNIVIEHCDIRSMLTASANPLTGAYSGGDLIKLSTAVRGAFIYKNTIVGAPHTGIGTPPVGFKANSWNEDIRIIENYITNPVLEYGRALDLRGQNIVAQRNIIENCKTRSQFAANNLLVEHNIFKNTFGRPNGYSNETSDAIRCQTYGVGTTDWAEVGVTTIANNTIDGCVAAGIWLQADGGIPCGNITIVNNHIRRVEVSSKGITSGSANATVTQALNSGTFSTLTIENNLTENCTFSHLGTVYTPNDVNSVLGYGNNFEADTQLSEGGQPLPNSPLLDQGIKLGYRRDINGRQCDGHIGAYGLAALSEALVD